MTYPLVVRRWRHGGPYPIRLVAADGRQDGKAASSYFAELYRTLADTLASGGEALFGVEGREHTAQVDPTRREWRFRWGDEDRANLAGAKEQVRLVGEPNVFLPALFCSPTMELGVDISAPGVETGSLYTPPRR